MYNFNFQNDEKLIDIFENILIKQDNNEKITTIALTNQRLLFLDYITINEGLEALRIAKGVNYMRQKEVYYQIDINNIKTVLSNEYYQVILKDNTTFQFNNHKLYNLLINKK